MIAILILLAMLAQPAPPPNLRAQWDSHDSATVSWSQSARACLYAKSGRVFVGCYDVPGDYAITFGHAGPMDGALRPMGGDVFVLESQGRETRAVLRGRAVWLPVWRG